MIRREILFGVIVLIIAFAALEAAVRVTYIVRNAFVDSIILPYAIGGDYGPVPPWIDNLRILETTSGVMWRGRPDLNRTYVDIFGPAGGVGTRGGFWPRAPDLGEVGNQWQISLNSKGFRDEDFPRPKPPGRFRIMALGDSWTFGANVGQDKTYPALLEDALAKTYPDAEFEVLNLGVLGFGSYNVLKLFRERSDLEPDLVIIAVAMNEFGTSYYREYEESLVDSKSVDEKSSLGFWQRFGKQSDAFAAWIEKEVEFYKLLKYWATLINWQPAPMDEHFSREIEKRAWEGTGGGEEPWMRKITDGYARNIRDLIEEVRAHGAGVILLYAEFWENGPFLRTLRSLASEIQVPLVDASALLAEARRDLEHEIEADLRLKPVMHNDKNRFEGSRQLLFRVYAEDVPDAIYIVGPYDGLGALCSNKVRMHDDGRDGDQVGGDNVWSYLARLPKAESDVFYVYTNSGRPCIWEGLDVPYIRRWRLADSAFNNVTYAPIDTFGRVYMHADPWHTNRRGYALIAQALLDEIRVFKLVQDHLGEHSEK